MEKIKKLKKLEKYYFNGIGEEKTQGEVALFVTNDEKCIFRQNGEDVLMHYPLGTGVNAYYQYVPTAMPKKIKYLLMDLDGTSIQSEGFWVHIIEAVAAKMTCDETFRFKAEDEPFVSGYTVSEHLTYMLKKYAEFTDANLEKATKFYFEIVREELAQIESGTYKGNPFEVTKGLKELLIYCKNSGVKVALVSSGLIEKARPEIISACDSMGIEIFDYYDKIITGGIVPEDNCYGTLGNYCAKPHPWLYYEAMKAVGGNCENTLAIEDSSAGVLSAISAGVAVIGLNGGNIKAAGVDVMCEKTADDLHDVVRIIRNNN